MTNKISIFKNNFFQIFISKVSIIIMRVLLQGCFTVWQNIKDKSTDFLERIEWIFFFHPSFDQVQKRGKKLEWHSFLPIRREYTLVRPRSIRIYTTESSLESWPYWVGRLFWLFIHVSVFFSSSFDTILQKICRPTNVLKHMKVVGKWINKKKKMQYLWYGRTWKK